MEHLLNLFQITNQAQLNLHYRLVEIGQLPQSVTQDHNHQIIKSYVAKEFATPTAWVFLEGRRYLAINAHANNLRPSFEVEILQGLRATVRVLPETHSFQ